MQSIFLSLFSPQQLGQRRLSIGAQYLFPFLVLQYQQVTMYYFSENLKSDTPRRAGGLMSGAASKAVDPLAKRRAKARLSYLNLELSSWPIRFLLVNYVLADLL